MSLNEVVTGVEKELKIRRAVACEDCGGTGVEGGGASETCNLCKGSGRVQRVHRSFFGQFVNVGPCPQCSGRGTFIKDPCHACKGDGRVAGEARVQVKIPPGVSTGDYLNLRGEGDSGVQGGSSGDLQVLIEVEERVGWERHERDLVTELRIGPARAALGGKLDVPTLDGTATLDVPAGVQHGTLLRLKGKGLPRLHGGARGSQLVRVRIAVPEKLSREERKLLERLLEHEREAEERRS